MAEPSGRRFPARLHVRRDDHDRARRIAGGDREAFAQLLREYYPVAYELACRLLNDPLDAEEVTQDAFLKIHRAMDSFRGEASLKTWILRIVMRLSLNRRRDRSRGAWRRLGLHRTDVTREGGMPPEITVPESTTPEGHYLSQEARQRILGQIQHLPEGLRQVLVLNSLEQLSYDEISRMLDIPVGTVSSRLHAARKKLQHSLAQLGLL